MKFDTPATTNPIDQLKVVGKPTDRIDGPLKTTGTAPYAYDRHDVVPNQAYGYVVGSAIAKGRIASIDLTDAKAAPGVLAIVTAENAGKLGKGSFNTAKLLGGPDIEHYHQAIAVVVAETFEQARAAAQLVRVDYVRAKGTFDLAAAKDSAVKPERDHRRSGRYRRRRLRRRLRRGAGPARCDLHHARSGACDDGAARLDRRLERRQAHALDLQPDDRLERRATWRRRSASPRKMSASISPFIGGGFGGKLFVRADALLAALGARAAGRPVKVALHAAADVQQHHAPARDDPAHPHRRDRDGKITAIGHESWSGDLPGGKPEAAVQQTRLLYAGANRMTATRLAVLDLPEGNAMRAPGEAPGMMALEIAIDEMAEKLGLDPIEFRILNDTQVDPEKPEPALLAAPAGRVPAHRRRALRLEQAQCRSPASSATGAGWSAWASPPRSATTW